MFLFFTDFGNFCPFFTVQVEGFLISVFFFLIFIYSCSQGLLLFSVKLEFERGKKFYKKIQIVSLNYSSLLLL